MSQDNKRVPTESDREEIRRIAEQRVRSRLGALRELAELYKTLPHGSKLNGPDTIQRVSDLDEILVHQQALYENALTKAFESGGNLRMEDLRPWDCGVFVKNAFYCVTIDPVLFGAAPGKQPGRGTYIQIHYIGTLRGERSTYFMPITLDGKIVLNLVGRYNVDQLCIECPGTVTRSSEKRDEAISRLFKEKLGRDGCHKLADIGRFSAERGAIGDHVDYLIAIVGPQTKEATDPIYAKYVELTIDELLALTKTGEWKHPENGRVYKATDDYLRNGLFAAIQGGALAQLALEFPALKAWGPAVSASLMEEWNRVLNPPRRE